MSLLRTIILPFAFMLSLAAFAQSKLDSLQHIPEVVVTASYRSSEVRSSAPLQILSEKTIQGLSVLQVSDAIKYFSGVTVKDYGGIGGLKTVSVRSLGANHTAVSYDGIAITDCQTGQIDLGRFSLENVDMISLNVGQSDNIFQPARLFASASSLEIRTLRPVFVEDRTVKGKLSFKSGSWGLYNPSFLIEKKIGSKFSTTLSGEYLKSDGKYPYCLHYGVLINDSSSLERRQNTDVQNFRLEGTIFAHFSEKEKANLKLYYYQSARGLPGATIFYNTQNFSSQRLWDNIFFTQASYQKDFSSLFSIQINTKYNRAYLRYLDPTFLNDKGKEENRYIQQEYYGSVSVLYKVLTNFSFSASNDISWASLDADLYNYSYPTRFTCLSNLALKYVNNNMLATASLLSTFVDEKVKKGKAAEKYHKISPYLSFSVKPFDALDFRMRAFYKSIFRMPSFNDLYYSRIGNPNLRPETTQQFNLGVTCQVPINDFIPLVSLTADIYHNQVKDKIVAYPTKNIFVWTMLNYGKVVINGLDITAETTLRLSDTMGFLFGANYTYQRALNMTDEKGRDYKHQLPYTPRVSGSGRVGFETPWATLFYSVLCSGHRYALMQNYAENRLPGYREHNLSLSGKYKLREKLFTLTLEIMNLLDENYALVRYFPMPGRSWRASLAYGF